MKNIYDNIAILWLVAIVFIIFVIFVYIKENNKYKNSAYGKQSNNSFWKTLADQGARGEYRTSAELEKANFDHKLLFNCYIPNQKGDKTELDIIMISSKGIIVVENKNYSGWIFGDEQSKNWCETLKGKKYFFYNPIKQNRSHIKNLEKLLQLGDENYTSLITFNGNANLKKIKVESKNIFVVHYNQIKGFIKNINNREDYFDKEKIEEIYNILLPGTQLSEEEKKQHVERIKKEYKK